LFIFKRSKPGWQNDTKSMKSSALGGVGAVFRAYDSQLKRWVAVKRLLTANEANLGQEHRLRTAARGRCARLPAQSEHRDHL
jgi:hypothetical protein